MNADQGVDPCDLEQPDDAGVACHETKAPTRFRKAARCGDEHSYPGRVQERAPGEIDDHDIRSQPRERLLEPGGGREVQLAPHVQRRGISRQLLAANVKIA